MWREQKIARWKINSFADQTIELCHRHFIWILLSCVNCISFVAKKKQTKLQPFFSCAIGKVNTHTASSVCCESEAVRAKIAIFFFHPLSFELSNLCLCLLIFFLCRRMCVMLCSDFRTHAMQMLPSFSSSTSLLLGQTTFCAAHMNQFYWKI